VIPVRILQGPGDSLREGWLDAVRNINGPSRFIQVLDGSTVHDTGTLVHAVDEAFMTEGATDPAVRYLLILARTGKFSRALDRVGVKDSSKTITVVVVGDVPDQGIRSVVDMDGLVELPRNGHPITREGIRGTLQHLVR